MDVDVHEVTVRDGTADDLPAVAAIYTHYVLKTTVTFNTHVRTPAMWLERYQQNVVDGPYLLLVAELGGQVVGYVETGRFRPHNAYDRSVEVSIYVSPDAGGRGVGGALYTELFDRFRDTDLHRAYKSTVDPRLNYEQALELAMLIVRKAGQG